jgi:hypothetical protein
MKRPEPQIDQIIGAFTSRDPRYAAFEDPPVTIREFVTLPEYGNHAAVTWPAIVDELEAIFGVDPVRFAHQQAVLEFAIGAGKSHLMSMAFTYMVYWALNLRDPQRHPTWMTIVSFVRILPWLWTLSAAAKSYRPPRELNGTRVFRSETLRETPHRIHE